MAGIATVWSLGQVYQAPPGETLVRIERVSGTAAIAAALNKAGVIRYEWQVWAARVLNPSARLQAGEYRFAEPASAFTVFDRLRRGDIYFFEFTVPEGSNRFDIARLIENQSDILSRNDPRGRFQVEISSRRPAIPRRFAISLRRLRRSKDFCFRRPIG